MELFHKIYSCYYNVVRHILDEAGHSPITRQDMEDICPLTVSRKAPCPSSPN